jgi:hypothetical protein
MIFTEIVKDKAVDILERIETICNNFYGKQCDDVTMYAFKAA